LKSRALRNAESNVGLVLDDVEPAAAFAALAERIAADAERSAVRSAPVQGLRRPLQATQRFL
jgi:hypothetical protein